MPLNPGLHARIVALTRRMPSLGQVKISNPEQRGAARVVRRPGGKKDFVVDDFGESYHINCPFCGEDQQKLYVNYRYGQPDPSSDGRRPLDRLFKCFRSECQADRNNRKRLWDWLYGLGSNRRYPAVIVASQQTVDLSVPVAPPGDLIPLVDLPDTDPVVGYLLLRRFDRETFRRFNLAYCTRRAVGEDLPVEGRIIIPIDFRGIRVGWQARLPYEPRSTRIPKYLTMSGLPKSQILYGYDYACCMPYLVLVEGVTSVWRLGDGAVAAFGKTLSEEQTCLLAAASAGQKPVIVLLDGGEDRATWEALHKLQRHRVPAVRVDLPPGFDPADFNRQQVFGLIYEQTRAQGVILPNIGATA